MCGGDACIGNTRIQVWVLVGYRRLGCRDAELFKCYPNLTAADLVNAWAYADAGPEEIEQAIKKMRLLKTGRQFAITRLTDSDKETGFLT